MFIGACPILKVWWNAGHGATYVHLCLYVILPIFFFFEKILVFLSSEIKAIFEGKRVNFNFKWEDFNFKWEDFTSIRTYD